MISGNRPPIVLRWSDSSSRVRAMADVVSRVGNEMYEFGPFRVDPGKQTLLRGGEPIAVTPKTFQLLLVLVRHGNEIVAKDELMKSVWAET